MGRWPISSSSASAGPPPISPGFEAAAAHAAVRRGLDGVICGHIHHAALRDLHGVLYGNDGDWVESCTALVEHLDGTLEILRWTHEQAIVTAREPRRWPEPPPAPRWATGSQEPWTAGKLSGVKY